jgi:ATP-dependent RNA helicase MRH4, mitochondrial
MKRGLDDSDFGITDGMQNPKRSRPVDILVGTPSKVLEMVRGWGWNMEDKIEDHWDDARKDRARKWIPGPPEAALANVEWVVIDEADILFGTLRLYCYILRR